MSFEEKIFDLINSKKTIKSLLYGFSFFLLLDIAITLFELVFLPGTSEKNLIAKPLILKFGNVVGLIMAVPIEFIILAVLFSIIYILLKIILDKREGRELNIVYLSLIIILFVAIILHAEGVRNNLSVLLVSF